MRRLAGSSGAEASALTRPPIADRNATLREPGELLMSTDTRQAEYTELTAACGHQVYVRLDLSAGSAAALIATSMSRDCGRSNCPMAQRTRAAKLQTRGICYSDLGGR